MILEQIIKSGYLASTFVAVVCSSEVSIPPMSLRYLEIFILEFAEGMPYDKRLLITLTRYASCLSDALINYL